MFENFLESEIELAERISLANESKPPLPDTTHRSHSRYSPSRLSYLALCLGWNSAGDSVVSEYAKRGTFLGEEIVRCAIEDTDPENREAQWAIEEVKKILEVYPSLTWEVERWVDTGIPEVTGYVDLVGMDKSGNNSVLIEIKSGWGKRAYPPHNRQISAYALGLMNECKNLDSVDAYLIEVDKNINIWCQYTRSDIGKLSSEIWEQLYRCVTATVADLSPGKHCAYCASKNRCEALETKAMAMTLPVAVPTKKSLREWAGVLRPEELAQRLDYVLPRAELVTLLSESLKERAIADIEAGVEVPGWEIRKTSGPRVWADEKAAIEAIEASGVVIEKHPPTPSQAEKLVDKNIILSLSVPGKNRVSLRKI